MAADAWTFFESAKELIGDGTIDLDNDTFKVALLTSSASPSAGTHDEWADLSTNEVANANGYTTGGITLTPTWTRSGGTVTFDSDNPVWTASGGSITARYAVIYDDTTTSPADALVAYSLLDNSPADVTATDGNTFTITMHASGIFTLS